MRVAFTILFSIAIFVSQDVYANSLNYYNQCSSKLSNLRTKYSSLQTSTNKLNNGYYDLQRKCNSMSQNARNIQEKHRTLTQNYNTLKQKYESLRATVNNMKSKNQQISQKHTELYNRSQGLNQKHNNLITSLNRLKNEYAALSQRLQNKYRQLSQQRAGVAVIGGGGSDGYCPGYPRTRAGIVRCFRDGSKWSYANYQTCKKRAADMASLSPSPQGSSTSNSFGQNTAFENCADLALRQSKAQTCAADRIERGGQVNPAVAACRTQYGI